MTRHDRYPIAFPILDDAQITALANSRHSSRSTWRRQEFAGDVGCSWK
jgi:hypothetical protein